MCMFGRWCITSVIPTNAVCWSREAVVWRHGTKFCIDPSSVQSRYHFDFVYAFIYECTPVSFFSRCSTFSYHFYLDGNLWPMDMTARHAWKHHLRKAVAVFVFLSLTHHRWGNVKHVLLLMTWKIEVRVTDLVMGWTPCVAEGPGSFIRVTCVSQRPFATNGVRARFYQFHGT